MNLGVMKESNRQQILEFVENYRCNWENYVLRMSHVQETHLNSPLPAERMKMQWEDPSNAGMKS